MDRFNNTLIENREVRIFLSSTFSDMDAEQSALVKLFNKLKLEANQRNVSLSLLDLRWGVTDGESCTGKVLSVCLNEIENSHPFFIGLLGSRYGYSPKESELSVWNGQLPQDVLDYINRQIANLQQASLVVGFKTIDYHVRGFCCRAEYFAEQRHGMRFLSFDIPDSECVNPNENFICKMVDSILANYFI